jgi:hypothetical protein
MTGVSFTVLRGSGFLRELEHMETESIWGLSRPWMMCRGSNVKDMPFWAFQLESLILAQNERWRQA